MVDDSKWERYAALGGFAFVALVIASIAISGSNPKASDSAAKIYKEFKDHRDGLKNGAFVGALAALPILFWAGSLWARMRRAEGRQPRLALVAVLALVFAGASQTASGGINAAVALVLNNVTASQAKFFYVLSQTVSSGGSVGLATMVLAVSALAFRTRVFPKWVAWIGIVDAIAWLVATYAIATTSDGISSVGFVAFAIWAIWIIIISVIMFRDRTTVAPVPVMQSEAPSVASTG
jgi:hypothetical protein